MIKVDSDLIQIDRFIENGKDKSLRNFRTKFCQSSKKWQQVEENMTQEMLDFLLLAQEKLKPCGFKVSLSIRPNYIHIGYELDNANDPYEHRNSNFRLTLSYESIDEFGVSWQAFAFRHSIEENRFRYLGIRDLIDEKYNKIFPKEFTDQLAFYIHLYREF